MAEPFFVTVPILGGMGTSLEKEEEKFIQPATELKDFSVEYSFTGFKNIIKELRANNFDNWNWFNLTQQADVMSLTSTFDSLLCVEHLAERWKKVGVIPYPHQIKTAERVLNEMYGLAILADEVGLGKTIEAGMILKEYMLRGLVKKVLILTPASLCWQWYQELAEKFDITAGIQRSEWDWQVDILIASIDTAKKEPHCEIIKEYPYDMIIIDEAHKLKNNKTASWQLVNSLVKKYCLMLTATPIQNDLKELYNLITLLKPGQLGSYYSFKKKFIANKRTPKNPVVLKNLLSEVLIRNRRGAGTVQFTSRIIHPIVVTLSDAEKHLYEEVTHFIKKSSQSSTFHHNLLPLITLQREVCSSFYAAGITLKKMYDKSEFKGESILTQLMEKVLAVNASSKCDKLEKLIAKMNDKLIIFTEYKATQEYIRYRLEKLGYHTLGFDGSLSRGRKEWIKHLFQQNAQVLVSTESGGEGLNFQFCNQIINFDLPWNPMRLEQRIGRVHRLGQTRDVHIYNLVTEGTIEEHIMYLLHEKINMFKMVLGELDAILLHLKLEKSFEGKIMDIFLKHNEDEKIREELGKFGDKILVERNNIDSNSLDNLL